MNSPAVYVVVEGVGERAFVKQVIAPYLAQSNVWVHAPLVGKPGHKGGVRSFEAVRGDLLSLLKQNRPKRPVYVSMMFDYYGMPHNWPGRSHAAEKAHDHKASTVERAVAVAIAEAMDEGFDPKRFIPYTQMHEFEALLLADPDKLLHEFPGQEQDVRRLVESIARKAPEEINDNQATSPSHRIVSCFPGYAKRKASAAPSVAGKIGMEQLRCKCPHFSQWIGRLEELGNR